MRYAVRTCVQEPGTAGAAHNFGAREILPLDGILVAAGAGEEKLDRKAGFLLGQWRSLDEVGEAGFDARAAAVDHEFEAGERSSTRTVFCTVPSM